MEFSISDLRNKNFEQTIEVAHHLGVRYIWIMGASRAREMWAQDLLQSAIYTRGWVFQGSLLNCLSRHSTNFFPERMLSSRIIHFTQSQVFWDCSTMSACEKLPEGIPFALSALVTTDRRWRERLQRSGASKEQTLPVDEDSLEAFWRSAVMNYTSCDLINQADKMFAIWSVAKLVRDHLKNHDQYDCGLWARSLHEQLAWKVNKP